MSKEYQINPAELRRNRILKDNDTFLYVGINGEIPQNNRAGLGLYQNDTCYLSCWEVELDKAKLFLLSSSTSRGQFGQFELSNWQFKTGKIDVPLGSLHLRNLTILKNGILYQRIRLVNFNSRPLKVRLKMRFGADFLDIFEIRSMRKSTQGVVKKPKLTSEGFIFSYLGEDKLTRQTEIRIHPKPKRILFPQDNLSEVDFLLDLEPRKKVYLHLEIIPSLGKEKTRISSFFSCSTLIRESYSTWLAKTTQFSSDNRFYNLMLEQAKNDLYVLLTKYSSGEIVSAGIPWFACPFGRDSLITGLQTLILNPELAKSALLFCASLQGKKEDIFTEEEPGKIFHELRFGELARTGKIPHRPYYGSIDATLLFIVLLAEYSRWTNDPVFLKKMLPYLERAISWIEKYGDKDEDGFIEYIKHSPKGLDNQGWKDSWDGVVDEKGNFPQAPIALVEVQGYFYEALTKAKEIFVQLGEGQKANQCQSKADKLKQNFSRYFWDEKRKFLAFGLDRKKRPFFADVSNAGHVLSSGIIPKQKALWITKKLFSPDFFSGWGIRTRGKLEKYYNPISYHNGSVWPHDNSLIARGLKLMEFAKELEQLTNGMYQAALHFDFYRLPELFCGFTKREDNFPVLHPFACPLHCWANGSHFLFLQACLGLQTESQLLKVVKPHLPSFLGKLTIKNLKLAGGEVDLEFFREKEKTLCTVLREKGNIKVEIE